MRLKHKILVQRLKLIPDYGILCLVPRKIKNIIALFIIDVLIWILVLTPFFTKSEYSFTNPALVSADTAVSEIVSPAIEAEQVVGEEGAKATNPQLHSDIEKLIAKEFGDQAEYAIKIAKCESSLDPSRIGDKHMNYWSYGLFQINRTWHKYPEEVLLDPASNIRIAKQIYDSGGWNRWSCNKLVN